MLHIIDIISFYLILFHNEKIMNEFEWKSKIKTRSNWFIRKVRECQANFNHVS